MRQDLRASTIVFFTTIVIVQQWKLWQRPPFVRDEEKFEPLRDVCFLEIMIHFFFFFLLCLYVCVSPFGLAPLFIFHTTTPRTHTCRRHSWILSNSMPYVCVCVWLSGAHTPSLKQMRILFCSVIFIVVFFAFTSFRPFFINFIRFENGFPPLLPLQTKCQLFWCFVIAVRLKTADFIQAHTQQHLF